MIPISVPKLPQKQSVQQSVRTGRIQKPYSKPVTNQEHGQYEFSTKMDNSPALLVHPAEHYCPQTDNIFYSHSLSHWCEEGTD